MQYLVALYAILQNVLVKYLLEWVHLILIEQFAALVLHLLE